MKNVIKILKFLVLLILTLCLIFVCLKNIAISTIFSQQYILQKLDETDFYSETYKIVESNFENYIGQSGLDDEVLNEICTQEKVRKDINIIISNIYEGTNEEIDTTEIAERLNTNIDNQNVRTNKNSSAIDEFVNHICDSYKDAIINTKYENQINEMYKKIIKLLDKINNIVIALMIISVVLLVIMNIESITILIANIATVLLSTSFLQFICMSVVRKNVNISNIKILNDAFSKTIVTIIKDIFSRVNKIGIILLVTSLIFIVVYEIIYYKKIKNKKIVSE